MFWNGISPRVLLDANLSGLQTADFFVFFFLEVMVCF